MHLFHLSETISVYEGQKQPMWMDSMWALHNVQKEKVIKRHGIALKMLWLGKFIIIENSNERIINSISLSLNLLSGEK